MSRTKEDIKLGWEILFQNKNENFSPKIKAGTSFVLK